jgi:hypothetical protein
MPAGGRVIDTLFAEELILAAVANRFFVNR